MKTESFNLKFVDFIPDILDNNLLYISMEYKIVVHKCACGCGNVVSLPLDKKEGWILRYDGENISIYPSIGNWELPCKSHYFITENRVEWSSSWEEYDKKIQSKNIKKKKKKSFFSCLKK